MDVIIFIYLKFQLQKVWDLFYTKEANNTPNRQLSNNHMQ